MPSAVFIQPPLATVGLTEEEALERVAGPVDVYVSKFRAMKSTITGGKVKTLIKMLVEADTDRVLPPLCRPRPAPPPPPPPPPSPPLSSRALTPRISTRQWPRAGVLSGVSRLFQCGRRCRQIEVP